MTPVVFVGIQPGTTQKSIRTLETWADRIGLKHYGFVNCISDPKKPVTISNVDWYFVEQCVKGSIPIALGKFPAMVLTAVTEPKDRDKSRFFELPHPSGLNRKLNDSDYVRRVLDECQQYLVRRDLEMRVAKSMNSDRVINAVMRTFSKAVEADRENYSPEDAFAIGVLTGWLSDPDIRKAFEAMVEEKGLA